MPEAQATRKTPTARRRQQREDTVRKDQTSFGNDSTIHDRIRQWQAQDVSEAVDPDVLSVRSAPRSERSRTPLRAKSPAQLPDEPQSTPRKGSTKWVRQNNAWIRQRRSVQENKRSPGTSRGQTVEPVLRDDIKEEIPPLEYTRNDSLRTRNVNSSRAERELRRKRRREARAKADNGHALTQDGIRVYARSDSHPASERFDRETVPALSEASYDQRSVRDDSQPLDGQDLRNSYQETSLGIENERVYKEDEDNLQDQEFRQPSRYAQTLGRAPALAEVIEPSKTRKRAILSKTKEMLTGKNETQPSISNRIPSIEAWLEEQPDMPDPFVDQKQDPNAQPVNIPPTTRHRSHRKMVPIEPTIAEVEDPNRIWDSVVPAQTPKQRRPSRKEPGNVPQQTTETQTPTRRLFSFEVCDGPSKGEECPPQPLPHQDIDSQSPVTLKRRSARTTRHSKDPRPVLSSPTKSPPKASSPQTEHRKANTPVTKATDQKKPLPQVPIEAFVERPEAFEKDAVLLDQASSTSLKRKLTTHEDLLSVLSQPRVRRSTRSNRSTRRAQVPPSENVIQEALKVMQQEEIQYARELRTLVDGVTPVLLQSLLSKNDSLANTGLFTDGHTNDANLTRPIVEMGGALQRLKNLHGRMPVQQYDQEALLAWAGTAHKAYSDYVKVWRLGFHGIVVNLEPLDGRQNADEEMSRDIDGDITNEQGQKVDVAFLQKRPLIRIKKLSKFFTAVREGSPGHARAASIADSFADLTEFAKQRHSEEQGRLEDEAAANTDITRARDIKTMGVIESVSIDRHRKVRARDYFDMTLQHSSGQRIDCKIEIILRDDPQPSGDGGDILICQVEEDSKWLLFAPVNLANVSARKDQSALDLVVMIRGVAGIGREWQELFALRAEEQEAVTEWLHMLGSNPLPPRLNCSPSWQQMSENSDTLHDLPSAATHPIATPIPLSRSALALIQSDVDIPIGEPSVILTRRKKKDSIPNTKSDVSVAERTPQKLNLGGGLQRTEISSHYQTPTKTPRKQNPISIGSPKRSSPLATTPKANPNLDAPSHNSKDLHSSNSNDKRMVHEPLVSRSKYPPQKFEYEPSNLSGATSISQNSYFTEREARPYADAETPEETRRLMREITIAEQSWTGEPLMSGGLGFASLDEKQVGHRTARDTGQDTSGTSQPEVLVNQPRKQMPPKSNSTTPLSETIREQWAAFSGFKKKSQSTPNTPEKTSTVQDPRGNNGDELLTQNRSRREETFTPALQARQETTPEPERIREIKPSSPRHQNSTYTISSGPQTSVTSLPLPFKQENSYRPEPTSPLKNQYQPSSSDSGTESDGDETDATSDISDDIGSEFKDKATSLVNVGYGNRRSLNAISYQKPSIPSSGTRTLDPSDSASNGPYRQALPSSAYPADKKKRTIAMVCSWSDRGIWEPIREDECSIVISPGLVQAFAMTAAHSQPLKGAEWEEGGQSVSPAQRPLVEFELTPVVPLRKGTALDITIRSPPTANSTVTTTNNVMFRSRTVQECEKLYQYINWARCHNPIFAQLARDRPRQEPVTFASNVQQSKGKSWFSFGSREKTSYRAPSRPPASMADTAASGSSATSAFSALRKFGKNSPFSLKRSSVVRRPEAVTSGSSLYSASNATGPSSGSSTPAPSQAGYVPGPDGPNVPATSAEAANGGGMVNNMKIRLFVRQGQKWEALGQSLLTVLPAAVPQSISVGPSTPTDGAIPPQRISRAPTSMPQPRTSHVRLISSDNTPHRIHGDGREKRILITNVKHKEHVLLDEILGESCFEKVMQTGIAINVWKEDTGVRGEGGVMTGRSKMYMIQFRTSTEASWVFNMCGTYRYGNAAPV